MKFFAVFPLLFIVVGCAGRLSNDSGYVQYHSGEAIHPTEKAIVEGRYSYRDGTLANEMTRIVEINGETIPREWGIAPGANKVSLLPGYYEIKVLYVHGAGQVDYYSYSTVAGILRKNCTYKIITKWSSYDKSMYIGIQGRPTVEAGQLDCSIPEASPEGPSISL